MKAEALDARLQAHHSAHNAHACLIQKRQEAEQLPAGSSERTALELEIQRQEQEAQELAAHARAHDREAAAAKEASRQQEEAMELQQREAELAAGRDKERGAAEASLLSPQEELEAIEESLHAQAAAHEAHRQKLAQVGSEATN